MTAYHAPVVGEGGRRCGRLVVEDGAYLPCGQLEEEHDDPDDLMARLAAYHEAVDPRAPRVDVERLRVPAPGLPGTSQNRTDDASPRFTVWLKVESDEGADDPDAVWFSVHSEPTREAALEAVDEIGSVLEKTLTMHVERLEQ